MNCDANYPQVWNARKFKFKHYCFLIFITVWLTRYAERRRGDEQVETNRKSRVTHWGKNMACWRWRIEKYYVRPALTPNIISTVIVKASLLIVNYSSSCRRPSTWPLRLSGSTRRWPGSSTCWRQTYSRLCSGEIQNQTSYQTNRWKLYKL